MEALVTIYMIVSIIFSLSALTYVVVDVVVEVVSNLGREKVPEEPPAPIIIEKIVEVPPPEPEIVEHITPEEADEMMSNSMAIKKANYESPAGHGKQGIINIGLIDEHFEAGEVVTLAVLKEKGLIAKNVGRMKVLAHGSLNKPLIIKSEDYSVQAMKMIELTGGTVIILRD